MTSVLYSTPLYEENFSENSTFSDFHNNSSSFSINSLRLHSKKNTHPHQTATSTLQLQHNHKPAPSSVKPHVNSPDKRVLSSSFDSASAYPQNTLLHFQESNPVYTKCTMSSTQSQLDIPILPITPKPSQNKIRLTKQPASNNSDTLLKHTPPQQLRQHFDSVSPISRNPSSSEENNSEENGSERNPSNKSMSSLATSVESTPATRSVLKYYDDARDIIIDEAPIQESLNSSASYHNENTSPVENNNHLDSDFLSNKNFPLSASNHVNDSVATASSNNSISTTKPEPQSKYAQLTPNRTHSSSSISVSSHKLVRSTSSNSQTPNFSTLKPSSSSLSINEPMSTPVAIAEPSLSSGCETVTGIAVDRPIIQDDALVATTPATSTKLSSIELNSKESNKDSIVRNQTGPSNAPGNTAQLPPNSTNSKQTERINTFPASAPSAKLAHHRSTASGLSYTSQRGHQPPLTVDTDVRTSGSQQHKSPMTIVRRRSLPQPQIASTQNLPPEERTDYYREQVIAMRELKRKKRKEYEDDERVLVGNKVSEGHANYAAAYYMLTGIRVSVSRCNAKVNRELTDEDFTARHKLAFDVSGNELIPSSMYDFKFKDYAPWVFRHLRELFKLDPADYLMSLTAKYIVSELSSPGKSGSFFYFSRDYRFIIKTIHHSEHKMLRKILKDYYNHVKNNPNTLISQFYGLHRVKLPFGKKIHFIVMNNLFPPHHDLHRTYDLKGSSLGREYISPRGRDMVNNAVQKDINWIKNKESLKLGPLKSNLLITQLQKDVELLKRLNIMDYSLLVGIHDMSQGDTKRHSLYVFEPAKPGNDNMKAADLRKAVQSTNPTAMSTLDIFAETFGKRDLVFYNDDGGFQATDMNNEPLPEIYYLGVIDCLTPYTFYKRVETFWKGLSHPRLTISAIPASEYGDRFFNFMKNAISSKVHRQKSAGTQQDIPITSGSLIFSRFSVASSEIPLPIVAEVSNEVTPESSKPVLAVNGN